MLGKHSSCRSGASGISAIASRAGGTLALLAATVQAANAFGATRPNVVIIVADDLGWGDVSCHGSVIPTPNIDRLIGEGIELDRFYTAPVSSPTRCGLMTGRYPSRFGIRETVIPPWRDYGLLLRKRRWPMCWGEMATPIVLQ